jgi:SAM-dependent methyltransferase
VRSPESLLRAAYRWFEVPHRFVATRSRLGLPGAQVLDVGCGNHSPSLTKRHFPECVYSGLDREEWNKDEADFQAMDRYILADLDAPHALGSVPDRAFDIILCSHVLEHVKEPEQVASELASKLGAGGVMYVETPTPKSLRLPHAANGWWGIKGCLNFYDDPTHRELVDLTALASRLRAEGFHVSPVRRRFLWRRVVLLPLYAMAGLLTRGYVPSSVVWDATGFAAYILIWGAR